LTADIPNVSEEATKDLDENGIIRVGAEVGEGDILIGKITPKGESDPSPEEKLLRAIFGDKAGDVKDASLKTPPSIKGVVIDTKLFSRAKKMAKEVERKALDKLETTHERNIKVLKERLVEKLFTIVNGKTSQGIYNVYKELLVAKGAKFTQKILTELDYTNVNPSGWTTDEEKNDLIKRALHHYSIKVNEESGAFDQDNFGSAVGDELPSGVVHMVEEYVSKELKVKVGGKMAGRHCIKGGVARTVRAADMPFLEGVTTVDIVLNPLG